MGNLTVKESGEMVNIISPNVNNITSFKVHFSPRQEGSGDPSPDNVREITGWNGVEGYGCGKNLFDSSKIVNKARLNQYGELLANTEDVVSDYIKVQSSNTYTVSGFGSLIFNERHCWYDKDKNYLKASANISSDVCTLTVPSDAEYVRLTIKKDYIESTQIELGSQATSYEPYQATTTTTDWTENVGTIYGGYVDLVSGELVQNFTKSTINDSTTMTYRGISNGYAYFNIKKGDYGMLNYGNLYLFSNYCTKTIESEWSVWIDAMAGNLRIYVPSTYNSLAKFKAYLAEHPLDISYKISEPITYQLTPQQLSTLKGQNNFWSNADYVEIEYELTETFDIQKAKRKIILNQPHVESVSGDLVTFDTDMKGKLKECKVYFSPVQEGEGDPSPDNVREITGWNGVSVGLPSEYQEVEWIESTGEQWIDSNIECTSELVVNFKMYNKDTSNLAMCGGIDATDGDVHFRHHCSPMNSDTNYWIQSGNGKTPACTIKSSERVLTFFIDPVNGKGVINDISIDFTPLTKYYTTGQSYGIFGRIHSNGTIQSKPTRIYYFKFYRNNALIGNFIPCYRRSDNEIGMYDIVSKQFFTNQGTDTFLKGADVDRIHGSIDWTNDVGTVYGGYVDLISGELVQTHYKLVADGINRGVVSSIYKDENRDIFGFRIIRNYFSPIGMPGTGSTIICDSLPILYNKYQSQVPFIYSYSNGNRYVILYCGKLSEHPELVETEDYQAFVNAWLVEHPLTFVYKLETPIHYQLTPQQLTALRGINNVYSNTNGQTEIKYWKH